MKPQASVAYYRVTAKDKDLEGQREEALEYLRDFWPPVAEFIEIEGGRKGKLKELKKAITYCKKEGLILVVPKVDLLSRDLELFDLIRDSEIAFYFCNMPNANPENIGIISILAYWERDERARRIKAGLAQKKEAGAQLGANNPKINAGLKNWQDDRAVIRAISAEHKRLEREIRKGELNKAKLLKNKIAGQLSALTIADSKVLGPIRLLKADGLSFKLIAEALNNSGFQSRQGKTWNGQQVYRVCKRNNI